MSGTSPKKKDQKPKPKRNQGGVFGLMSKRRWFIVVVFLCSLTWSYTAGPPLSDAYVSNRYFVNPNRFNYSTWSISGDDSLVFNIFEPKFWSKTWIWQAGAYFEWIEGPCWVGDKLYFSDTIKNRIYSYNDYQGVQIEIENSGDATDKQINELYEPGSNGLLKDPRCDDCIFIAQHAARRIISYNIKTNQTEVVVSEYNGKKLNSPNDMALDLNNKYLYFTDPPYGLQLKKEIKNTPSISVRDNTYADKLSDLGFYGIYRINLNDKNGKVELIDKTLKRPNGIAISRVNGKTRLYVTDSIINEFNLNVYEIDDKTNNVKFTEKWDLNTIQSNLKSNERMIGNNKELNGHSDGITIHPKMNYLFAVCPETKLCIINEKTGKLEAAIKFPNGVKLSNVVFANDNRLYITANGNLWLLYLNRNNLAF